MTGRKSAGAAAITTASADPAADTTASRSSSVVSTRTTLTPAGSGSDTFAATRVTSAPRAAAARARATPCSPEERLPRKRTGSIGSRVPPADTTTVRPARSSEVGSSADAAGQDVLADGEDLVGLGQAALAGVGAGEAADRRLEDQGAALAQRGDVRLGGGVLPHLGVHGRREDDRAASRQQDIGEQVVGPTVSGTRQQVGGGGCHDDQVGRLADPHVRHLVGVGPDVGGDRLAGQGGPGRRPDELQRGGGRDDGHVVAALGEAAQQLAGLVRRDAAGDAQDDGRPRPRPLGGAGRGQIRHARDWVSCRSRSRPRGRRPSWPPPRRRARPGRRPRRSAGRR